MSARRADYCAVALAELFRDAGEILASPMGTLPAIGARLARLTFAPDLMLSDGEATLLANTPAVGVPDEGREEEGWIPYRHVFDWVWWGRRHVVMGASQIDRFGNQNIAAIGDWRQPKVQLLGMRGAPGNTVCHRTSYWVPRHSTRTFVERVDTVSGLGNDRAALLGEGGRFHDVHRVVTNLGVFDSGGPDGSLRLVALHPGVEVDTVRGATGFDFATAEEIGETRAPSAEERRLLDERIDPKGLRFREVPE